MKKKFVILGGLTVQMLFSSIAFADNENAVRVMSASSFQNTWQIAPEK